MECTRCHGLMVAECDRDMGETSGYDWMRCWRCLNCGEVIDPLIVLFRGLSKSHPSRLPQVVKNRARLSHSSATRA